MRIVIDTGVLVSAAIKAQTVPNIAVHQAVQRGVLLKSSATEAELMDVIDRPYLARLIAPAARALEWCNSWQRRNWQPSPNDSPRAAIPRMTRFLNWP